MSAEVGAWAGVRAGAGKVVRGGKGNGGRGVVNYGACYCCDDADDGAMIIVS